MALRKKLSASLLLKADGKSVKTSSENMINDYIQTVEKLKLKNDKLGQLFWRELSFMVLDIRIPLIINSEWLENLWVAHDLFIVNSEDILSLKPMSFYDRITAILRYRHIDRQKFIRQQEWKVLGIDLFHFKEARDEKIKFYRDFASEIDEPMVSVCQKMSSKNFRLFLALIDENRIKNRIDLSVVLSLISQGSNLEGIGDFIEMGLPAFLEKLDRFNYKKDHKKVQLWFEFWKTNIPYRNHDEIVKGIGFVPEFVVKNEFDLGIINYLSWGINIKNFNPGEWYFTNKMAHLFNNYNGNLKRFTSIYHECLLRSLTENEALIQVLLYHRLGSKKNDVANYGLIVEKLESWRFETLENEDQQKMLGFLIHGFQDIEKFSLKNSTLNSITRRAKEFYEEILIQKVAHNRSEKFSQLTIAGKKREKKREKRLILQAQRKIEREKERRRLQKWEGIPIEDAVINGFSFVQLKRLEELITEGKNLKHCVGSIWYAQQCADRGTSIWSLRKKGGYPVLTIELNRHLLVSQIKGLYNRNPTDSEIKLIIMWAEKRKINFTVRNR